MTPSKLFSDVASALARWARLVPSLLRNDPIFRYATIAAASALLFLIARFAQELAGPSTIPSVGEATSQGPDGSATKSRSVDEPPAPGSATTLTDEQGATPLKITPGRSLEGIEVEPAPRDSFGTLPQGDRK